MATRKVKWIGSAPKCDFCGKRELTDFVDGRTNRGPWAIMCPSDFIKHAIGIGPGVGQRYKLHEDGEFYKVEG